MKTKAVGYVRVSTEDQAREGFSLGAQRAKVEAYAMVADLDLVEVFSDEGISAKRVDNRPGLQAALEALRSGRATAIVVVKLDRLSRRTRDVLDFVEVADKKGWAFHSITEKLDTSSAAGRFVVTITAALAQMERELIGERTAAAMAHMKEQGLRVGAIPFGFDLAADGRTLTTNAAEQNIITEAEALAEAGNSLRKIAAELNARGYTTKNGKPWTHVQVGRLLAA